MDWFIVRINLECRLDVVERAARGALGIAVGNLSIKAHTTSAHEGLVVERAVVAHLHMVVIDNLNSLLHVHGNLQVASQAVT